MDSLFTFGEDVSRKREERGEYTHTLCVCGFHFVEVFPARSGRPLILRIKATTYGGGAAWPGRAATTGGGILY